MLPILLQRNRFQMPPVFATFTYKVRKLTWVLKQTSFPSPPHEPYGVWWECGLYHSKGSLWENREQIWKHNTLEVLLKHFSTMRSPSISFWWILMWEYRKQMIGGSSIFYLERDVSVTSFSSVGEEEGR